MRWDRKKLLELNLHVYGIDDIQIRVYKNKRSPKRGDREKKKKNQGERTKEQVTKKELLILD